VEMVKPLSVAELEQVVQAIELLYQAGQRAVLDTGAGAQA